MKLYPYACLNIDCTWADWLRGLRRAIHTGENRNELLFQLHRLFTKEDNAIVTVSVRTILDLYLLAKNFPKGSEVLMSAVNIPELTKIIRFHGLIPVPVDINIDTLQMSPQDLEAAVSPRACMILVAFLYGTRYDLAEIAEVSRKYNLPIFEDCAEGFSGLNYNGQEHCEVSTTSFGPIKTATAFGGAVSIIRDPQLLSQIRTIHSQFPVQPRNVFLKKVLKYSLGMIAMNSKFMNRRLRPMFHLMNYDYKKGVVGLMRGFSPEDQSLDKYRFQPCTALLSFLLYRLANFSQTQFQQRINKVQKGADLLEASGVTVPGNSSKPRSFWLFPIMAENTEKVYDELNHGGIDAYKGVTQLDVVKPPTGSSYKFPEVANKMINQIVYLPVHKDVAEEDLLNICRDAALVVQRSKL